MTINLSALKDLEKARRYPCTRKLASELRMSSEDMQFTIALREVGLELLDRLEKLEAVAKMASEVAKCPYVIEPATVPKAGIDTAPWQIVGTIHLGYLRREQLLAALSALDIKGGEAK